MSMSSRHHFVIFVVDSQMHGQLGCGFHRPFQDVTVKIYFQQHFRCQIPFGNACGRCNHFSLPYTYCNISVVGGNELALIHLSPDGADQLLCLFF